MGDLVNAPRFFTLGALAQEKKDRSEERKAHGDSTSLGHHYSPGI